VNITWYFPCLHVNVCGKPSLLYLCWVALLREVLMLSTCRSVKGARERAYLRLAMWLLVMRFCWRDAAQLPLISWWFSLSLSVTVSSDHNRLAALFSCFRRRGANRMRCRTSFWVCLISSVRPSHTWTAHTADAHYSYRIVFLCILYVRCYSCFVSIACSCYRVLWFGFFFISWLF
jgi:hypothetical protein